MISQPNKVKIDLSALTYNLNQVKKLIGPDTKIMGVVKSDAYGHGIAQISKQLEANGVFSLGVAHLGEALGLRNSGIRSPITVLCGVKSQEEVEALLDKDLTTVIFDISILDILSETASRRNKRLNIQLKIDTGMGRLGIPFSEIGLVIEKIMRYKTLNLEGMMSHLSSADEPERDFTESQIQKFQSAVEIGRSMGLDLPLNSLANSAGVMTYKNSHFDLVRPGIMLYGGLPSPGFQGPLQLRPVMEVIGKIIQIRELPDQTPVSYGRTYYTQDRQRIAIISAGYGDGIPRILSNKGKVLIGGRKVDIVGRVCMNMIMCNMSGVESAQPGDEVVLLGSQGEGTITGDDIAKWAETISYEIFCSIGRNVVREYIR